MAFVSLSGTTRRYSDKLKMQLAFRALVDVFTTDMYFLNPLVEHMKYLPNILMTISFPSKLEPARKNDFNEAKLDALTIPSKPWFPWSAKWSKARVIPMP